MFKFLLQALACWIKIFANDTTQYWSASLRHLLSFFLNGLLRVQSVISFTVER